MMCFKNISDFILQGDFYSEKFNYLEIKVQKCINTTENKNGCKSESEINEFFKKK